MFTIIEYKNNGIVRRRGTINAKLGERFLQKTEEVIAEMMDWSKIVDFDPKGVFPYWLFAAECLRLGAQKICVLTAQDNTITHRKALAKEQRKLLSKFKKLWMIRNQPSEIKVTIEKYVNAINSLTHS